MLKSFFNNSHHHTINSRFKYKNSIFSPLNSFIRCHAVKSIPILFILSLSACQEPGSDDDKPSSVSSAKPISVELFAGSRTASGLAEGQGTIARLNSSSDIAVASDGNIYVADFGNHRIRKITPSGVVTTFAGSTSGLAEGQGMAAQFKNPNGIAFASDGNIYVNDYGNHRIRKITPSGVVTAFAGSTSGLAEGQGTAAQFRNPTRVAVASDGNIYVSDTGNYRIRKITPSGVVATLAGNSQGSADGQGVAAQFNNPRGIAVASDGNIYVVDQSNHRIRKITPSGVVSTLAGSSPANSAGGFADGQGVAAQFHFPFGITVGPDGYIYVADSQNNRIRRISPSGKVSTIIDDTVAAKIGGLNSPWGITFTSDTAYITDDHRVIRVRFGS